MKISIVTTTFNEERNIAPMCEKIKDAMEGMNYEIIAVDDCSTDKTFSELKKIKGKRVKIIKLKEHKGKAFALYEEPKKAKGGIIVTIDADQRAECPKVNEEKFRIR